MNAENGKGEKENGSKVLGALLVSVSWPFFATLASFAVKFVVIL